MKKNTHNNSFIKKQLRKAGINPQRITNGAGIRVWKIGDREYPSLAIVQEELTDKKENK